MLITVPKVALFKFIILKFIKLERFIDFFSNPSNFLFSIYIFFPVKSFAVVRELYPFIKPINLLFLFLKYIKLHFLFPSKSK